jgi:hypothetical protein
MPDWWRSLPWPGLLAIAVNLLALFAITVFALPRW